MLAIKVMCNTTKIYINYIICINIMRTKIITTEDKLTSQVSGISPSSLIFAITDVK